MHKCDHTPNQRESCVHVDYSATEEAGFEQKGMMKRKKEEDEAEK